MLRQKSGILAKVADANVIKLENPVKVYNFTVEDFHTYYVSNLRVLVHNNNCLNVIQIESLAARQIKKLSPEAKKDLIKH